MIGARRTSVDGGRDGKGDPQEGQQGKAIGMEGNITQVKEQELCSEVSCDVKQGKNAAGQHDFPYLANILSFESENF